MYPKKIFIRTRPNPKAQKAQDPMKQYEDSVRRHGVHSQQARVVRDQHRSDMVFLRRAAALDLLQRNLRPSDS